MSDLVSVIIPTYKRPVSFLSRAVESIINQTYSNIEIIVVDDSPKSFVEREAIKDYVISRKTRQIIYLQNEKNLGGSLTRNRGIEKAKGKYITFLDDDDEYLPQKIANQVAFMEETDCDLSFSNMRMYNKAEKVVDYREYNDIWSFDNNELLKYHLMRHITGTPTFMFKSDKLKEIGGFEDAIMGQEFYLMLKSIKRNLVIRYLDTCDVKVYKHEREAISSGKNKIIGEKRLYEYKKKYFGILNHRQKRYVRFRHWAVMAVAYKRNKMYYLIPFAAGTAFMSSPVDFFREIDKYIRNIQKIAKE